MRKPSKRNSTRDREKAERMSLRSLVVELETHVNALSGATLTRSHQSGKSAWQSLAERQARARTAAEQVNRELNERVQSNADWIQRLWELLQEKWRAVETTRLKKMSLPLKGNDNLVLDQLKQQTQAAVTELPNIFAVHGISVLDESVQEDYVRDVWSHEQTGEAQSTLVCVRRIPFDIHSTSTAMWAALSRPVGSFLSESRSRATSQDSTLKARVVERTPSMCAMKVQDKMLIDTEETVVDYHAVVCRDTLAQSHVFVWQSLVTLANGSVRYEDTMWAAVARGSSTSMEAFIAIVSQSQLTTKAGVVDSVNVKGSIMPAIEGCVDSFLSSTEDLLLGESVKRSSYSSSSSDETGSITV